MSIFILYLGLAVVGFTLNSTLRLELIDAMSVCLDLLISTERLERNVIVELTTEDETATGTTALMEKRDY